MIMWRNLILGIAIFILTLMFVILAYCYGKANLPALQLNKTASAKTPIAGNNQTPKYPRFQT
jgi:hypothetical protein